MRLNEKYTEYFSVGEEGGKIYVERIFVLPLLLGYHLGYVAYKT